MPREKFEHELQRLKDEILALGAMAESVQALKKRDTAKAHSIMDDDRLINEKRYAIEDDTLTLIATQQPMAGTCARWLRSSRSPRSWSVSPTTPRESPTSLWPSARSP